MEDLWKHYQLVDFTDKEIKQYNIDTRDFHVLEMKEIDIKNPIDLEKILKPKNKDKFFFTEDEVKILLNRLFNDSGRNCKWRYLTLTGEGKIFTSGWQIKYIRIIRTEQGLLVCNSYKNAIRKDIWSYPVNQNQDILNAH